MFTATAQQPASQAEIFFSNTLFAGDRFAGVFFDPHLALVLGPSLFESMVLLTGTSNKFPTLILLFASLPMSSRRPRSRPRFLSNVFYLALYFPACFLNGLKVCRYSSLSSETCLSRFAINKLIKSFLCIPCKIWFGTPCTSFNSLTMSCLLYFFAISFCES